LITVRHRFDIYAISYITLALCHVNGHR